jgi:hypothetical protein
MNRTRGMAGRLGLPTVVAARSIHRAGHLAGWMCGLWLTGPNGAVVRPKGPTVPPARVKGPGRGQSQNTPTGPTGRLSLGTAWTTTGIVGPLGRQMVFLASVPGPILAQVGSPFVRPITCRLRNSDDFSLNRTSVEGHPPKIYFAVINCLRRPIGETR